MGDRIDDQQIDAVLGLELSDALEQATPLVIGGQMGKRLREEANIAAEIELAAAFRPQGARLLGNDDGLSRSDRAAEKGLTGASPGKQVGQEGGLAGLPHAGEERHVAPGNETGQQPIGGRFRD